jgi:hypothetical protein
LPQIFKVLFCQLLYRSCLTAIGDSKTYVDNREMANSKVKIWLYLSKIYGIRGIILHCICTY